MDDLTLGEIVNPGEQSQLQTNLDDLSNWCKNNDVLPNPSKCQIMKISCLLRHQTPNYNVSLNSSELKSLTQMKLLGITIQNNLKWDSHVAHIVYRASCKLFTLCILRKSGIPRSDLVSVYICYIRPVVEYASQVWHSSITKQQAKQIELRACRIILGCQEYQRYSTALTIFDLLSLKSRRDILFNKWSNKLLQSTVFRHACMLPSS